MSLKVPVVSSLTIIKVNALGVVFTSLMTMGNSVKHYTFNANKVIFLF